MPKCILSGQVKSTFTQEQADGRYIQMTNGATTTLASSLQISGINNIEFTEEGEESITASNVSYSNTTSGMTSGNVQGAIDELFQSVSEGKSLIAAAVTDKGVETAATDSFATMAGNIGQISGGTQLESVSLSVNITSGLYSNLYYYSIVDGYTTVRYTASYDVTDCLKDSIVVFTTSADTDIEISGDYAIIPIDSPGLRGFVCRGNVEMDVTATGPA